MTVLVVLGALVCRVLRTPAPPDITGDRSEDEYRDRNRLRNRAEPFMVFPLSLSELNEIVFTKSITRQRQPGQRCPDRGLPPR